MAFLGCKGSCAMRSGGDVGWARVLGLCCRVAVHAACMVLSVTALKV